MAHPDFSASHRILSDELWHFHDGAPVRIHMLDESGTLQTTQLGIAAGACRKLRFPPDAGLRRNWNAPTHGRWPAARWRRALIFPISPWPAGRISGKNTLTTARSLSG